MNTQNEAMAAEALYTERHVRQQHERTISELRAEIERLTAALGVIARTTFSGSDSSDDYMRGNQDAHETCARLAQVALRDEQARDAK